MSLFSELKRRNVFRVALAYLVLSWLVLQVADVLVEALELPSVWSKGVIALLVIGFIPTIVFSWVYELTPEGVKRESEVNRERSITPNTGHKLNIAVVVMLGIAIALFAADRFMGPRPSQPLVQEATVPPAEAATEAPQHAGVPVVAVLPLQALSTEDEGRFLASGLHDDLLTRLARLEAFRVISRTSVMEYANTTKNLKQVADELGAGFIVEGGLQAIGGRVRINAQLIDAETDEHLWAETFERPLTPTNLFEVQGEIAAAIAQATHATLSPRDVAVLETVPTESMQAYQTYLRGLEIFGDISKPSMHRSLELFRRATEIDPGFVEAWALLAAAHLRLYWEEGGEVGMAPNPVQLDNAAEALANAEALDPDNTQTLLSRAYYHYYGFRDYSSALIVLGRAEALAPNNVEVVGLRGFLLRRLGRMNEAADALLEAYRTEPAWVGYNREALATLVYADRCAEALDLKPEALERFPNNNGVLDLSAWATLICSGDRDETVRLAKRIRPTNLVELESKFRLLLLSEQEPGTALRVLENADEDLLLDPVMRLVVNDYRAWVYRSLNQESLAKQALAEGEAAIAEIGAMSFGILAEKAFHAALKGDRQSALDFGRAALEAAPEDALIKSDIDYRVARAWATAGLLDEALAQLATLRSEIGSAEFESNDIDPFLAPLKSHPDYERLMGRDGES